MTLPVDADQLFALPLEEFTVARNALAKELTKAGDRDGAAAVKAMRKPTATAWALNQVSRERGPDIERLLEAGDQLRVAQREVLEGDPSMLREARRAFEGAVDGVVRAAGEVIAGSGKTIGPTQLDRLSATVQATATDEEARALLQAGRLDRDFAASGFGFDAEALPVVGPRPAPVRREKPRPVGEKAPPAAVPSITAREIRRLATLAQRAEAKAQRLSREADEAERNAIELRRLADEAAEAATSARRAADDAGHRSESSGSVP